MQASDRRHDAAGLEKGANECEKRVGLVAFGCIGAQKRDLVG